MNEVNRTPRLCTSSSHMSVRRVQGFELLYSEINYDHIYMEKLMEITSELDPKLGDSS